MFKYYFEDQYCININIKLGLMLYIILALLVMPAGLCSQQHQVPYDVPGIVQSKDLIASSADAHRDFELAFLERAVWEEAHQIPGERDGGRQVVAEDIDAPPFQRHIIKASETYQIEAALIKAIIMAESSFNPRAVSKRGAQGLMQLMPTTAKWLGVDDAFDPALNIDGGVRYLRRLIDRFKGDVELALAAYNAGSRYVRKYGGVPPFKATRTYVKKVLKLREGYLKEFVELKTTPPA
jgi:soluble lytic murein transglycosylase-like protein